MKPYGFAALALFTFIIYFVITSCGITHKESVLNINGRPLYVEIARTPKQRERGLMGREDLDRNRGMIFVFESDEYLSFWMKDTILPLSIAFLDSQGKVVDLFDMQPRSLIPVQSTKRCRYAIEVNRGFFEDVGLETGDLVDVSQVER
jgi:uncharacterized membrane protein (UPF0127 family)